MINEDFCILAQSGNADAESELIDHLLPSLKALAAKFEAQYSGLQIEADDLLHEGSIGLLGLSIPSILKRVICSRPSHP